VVLDDRDFARLGHAFKRETGAVAAGRVGAARCRLFDIPDAVDYAGKWFTRNRGAADA
jgi:aminoglycoside 3-N-acetyltransferase